MAAPQVFQPSDSPRYKKGFTVHFCLYVIFNVILAVTRFLLTRRNSLKRAAAAAAQSVDVRSVDEKITHARAFEDLTDRENPDFRYVF